jgi:DNA-binding response OmpR family regulator
MVLKHILIIETSPEVRLLLKRILEDTQSDYEVVLAQDSFRALDRLLQQPFDLILLDQQVTGIGWLSLAQIIRAVWPDTRLLLMGGQESVMFDVKKKSPAFDDFLPKPFTPTQLLTTVAYLTNGSKELSTF